MNRVCADCEAAAHSDTYQLFPGVGADTDGARCRVARDITVCRGSIADTRPGSRIVQIFVIFNSDQCPLIIRTCLQIKAQLLIGALNRTNQVCRTTVGGPCNVRRIPITRDKRNINLLNAGRTDCSRLIDFRKIRSALLTVQLVAMVIKELYLYANLIRRIASVGVLNLDVLVRHFAGQHTIRGELELVVCCQGIRAVNACVRVIRVTAHDLCAVKDKARNGRRRHVDIFLSTLVIRGSRFNRGAGLIHILRAKGEFLIRIHNIEITNGQVIVRHHAADDISADNTDLCCAGAGTGCLTEFALFIVLYNDRADLIARHRRCGERNCCNRIARSLLRCGNPGCPVRVKGNVVAGIEAAAIGRRKLGGATVQHAVVHYRVVEVLRHTARNPLRRIGHIIVYPRWKCRFNILQRIGSIVPTTEGIAVIRHSSQIRECRSRVGIACVCRASVRMYQRDTCKARDISQRSSRLGSNNVTRIAIVTPCHIRSIAGVKGNRGRCRIDRQRRGCHGKYHDSRHRRGDPRLEIMSQSHLIPPQ